MLTFVLEPLALFLATRNGRVPIHASAIRVGDLAILLAGPSGAGKSSLALAAHRAGLTVLSEDTVYVSVGPALAIWGWKSPIHLLPGNTGLETTPLRMRNGRIKQVISFKNAASHTQPAKSAVVCILKPGVHPTLTRLATAPALDLLHPLEPGFDLLGLEIHAAVRLLCRDGAWLLGLSRSPDEAIALILANAHRLSGTAIAEAKP